jgi:hypothetical protein
MGNSYVTGYYEGTATIGDSTFTSAGSFDVFIAKYGPAAPPIPTLGQWGIVLLGLLMVIFGIRIVRERSVILE